MNETLLTIQNDLLSIKHDTARMNEHIDFVEKHISWVEKIIRFFIPTKKDEKHDIISRLRSIDHMV